MSEVFRTRGRGLRPSAAEGRFELSASMMCANPEELGSELTRLEGADIDSLHFDIMDGHFVPNLALTPAVVMALRSLTERPFIAHMMVENPAAYIGPMSSAGADMFVPHIEACSFPRRLMRDIAAAGMQPGIAIGPATSVDALESILDVVDCVMVMSVEPGFAGAEWVPTSPKRVEALRAMCPRDTVIAVDGHIDFDTSLALRRAGADAFVCGTKSVFAGAHTLENYRTRVMNLRQHLATVQKGRAV